MLKKLTGIPWTKLVVPSIGSTIQSQSGPVSRSVAIASLPASHPPGTDSSPRKPCVGNAFDTADSMMRCTSGSTSVSRSRVLALVLTTSAPSLSSMTAAPSFAASVATLRHAWRIAERSVWSRAASPPSGKEPIGLESFVDELDGAMGLRWVVGARRARCGARERWRERWRTARMDGAEVADIDGASAAACDGRVGPSLFIPFRLRPEHSEKNMRVNNGHA